MAQYRCLADIYLPGDRYAQASDILSDAVGAAVPIPVGWIPSLAVDPITPDAIQAFWNAGPKGQGDAEPNQWAFPHGWSRWSNVGYAPAAIYWQRVLGGFQLTGGGASLGVHPPVL